MSFFRYIFRTLLLLLILSVLVFIGFREYSLIVAKSKIEADIVKLSRVKSTPQAYQRCLDLSGSLANSEDEFAQFQLRFVSDQEYILETLCAGFEFVPEIIGKGTLPSGVYKKPGSSGLMLSQGSWQLDLWYQPSIIKNLSLPDWLVARKTSILLENGRSVSVLSQIPEFDTPLTLCAGYGYDCCDQTTEQGLGSARKATDCLDHCFAVCAGRPAVLAFSARDFDQYTRTLRIKSGLAAQYFFQISDQGKPPVMANIEFGDGQSWQGMMSEESANHIYVCRSSRCIYQAKLSLIDSNGVHSVESPISIIQVIVEQ